MNKKSYILVTVLVLASIITACGGPLGSSVATQVSLTAMPIILTAQATNANTTAELNAANAAIAALIALVNRYVASGDITGNAENGLLAKLDGIQDKVTRGDTAPAANQMEAFINEVEAQRGKKITVAAANDLIAKAQVIIAMLRSPAALVPVATSTSIPASTATLVPVATSTSVPASTATLAPTFTSTPKPTP